ncbi:hypothetical protein HID58_048069 [Brassica napus]|uniref:Zinc knuckle CX2CX4HX4C domain-containing protein n=1 Tax=Brassica napus TaxID=3708 RepID=A0ABQ8B109_BRANA|nr:hypothetical protein HID58_048069 [Brassica napus]
MLIDVDTRRPLKFSRQVESKDGDEVTIEIKYETLFKHCFTCGMLTYEKDHCPSLDMRARLQPQTERSDVFARMQPPQEQSQRHKLHNDHRVNALVRQPYGYRMETSTGHLTGLCDIAMICLGVTDMGVLELLKNPLSTSREIVPYEQTSGTSNDGLNASNAQQVLKSGEGNSAKRLASTIVTPSRVDHDMDDNVTKRAKGLTRSLSFTTLRDQEPVSAAGDNQIIGALNDMDIEDHQDDGMMECEVMDEDLLGMDLKEMEDTAAQYVATTGLRL